MSYDPTPEEVATINQWWQNNGYSGIKEYISRNKLENVFQAIYDRDIDQYLFEYPDYEDGYCLYLDMNNLQPPVCPFLGYPEFKE